MLFLQLYTMHKGAYTATLTLPAVTMRPSIILSYIIIRDKISSTLSHHRASFLPSGDRGTFYETVGANRVWWLRSPARDTLHRLEASERIWMHHVHIRRCGPLLTPGSIFLASSASCERWSGTRQAPGSVRHWSICRSLICCNYLNFQHITQSTRLSLHLANNSVAPNV